MYSRCLCALVFVTAVTPPTLAQTKAEPLALFVDASDAGRRFVRATLSLVVKPGPLTLYYPKWIPGEHGPSGPITDLAGLKITAGGKDVPWQRDEVDMYAFHCKVPDGASKLEVSLNFLSPSVAAGFSAGASMTPSLAVVNWNQVLLYPKGSPARDIVVKAALKLPAGWKLGTALDVAAQKGDVTEFAPVPLDTLVDSPLIAGRHFKEVPLGPNDGPPHFLYLASDSATAIELSPAVKGNLDRLVVEGGKLFGARHYRSYRFLFALSDQIAHFGLEHHQSSDNRGPEGLLIDDRIKKNNWAQLLPHEYVHSWNGKYRRPADMVTATFQEPQRTKHLWIYEGLTQYLGVVLTARCGLFTPEQFRDNLAMVGEWSQNQRGRAWRPLEDTAIAAQLLYYARGDYASWRRGTDFYDEGILLWLDVDTLIREKSKGKKSLDDFCRRFFGGAKGGPQGGDPTCRPFTLSDMIADLDAIVPHDWQGLFEKRTTAAGTEAPLDGLRRGGWKLGYGEKATDFMKENESENKNIDLTASLGLSLREDGTVSDVIPGKIAHKAGVGPGMKMVAVNTRRWSAQGLRNALAASKKTGKVDVILENGEFFLNTSLPYDGGERYPRLERLTDTPDLIGAIVAPLDPPAKK